MCCIWIFEECVGEFFVCGQLVGLMLYLLIGEELSVVGVFVVMQLQDMFIMYYCGYGIFLVCGVDFNWMMVEIVGKEIGYCYGKGGFMYIVDMVLGYFGVNVIVGGGILVVVGVGFFSKMFKQNLVLIVFFGDGVMQQGIFYESMNMVVLWGFFVFFCCINNQYGMGMCIDQVICNIVFDECVKVFGLNGIVVNGLDVEEVEVVVDWLICEVCVGKFGFFSIEVYCFFGYVWMDKSFYCVEVEEIEGCKKDFVFFVCDKFVKVGFFSEVELMDFDQMIMCEMDVMIDFVVQFIVLLFFFMFCDVYVFGELELEFVCICIDCVLVRDDV